MKLIIQIPCFNEEESLPKTVKNLPTHIDGVDTIEFLIIDDGSTDRTVEVAKESGVHHILKFTRWRGLACAFAAGLNYSLEQGADIIVNFDADGQYKGEDIPRLVQPILEGSADIVIGNRDIENVKQFSWLKKRLQRLGSWMVRQLAGSTVMDATTGFRAYSSDAAMRLNIISDYTYTLESIIQAEKKGLAVANITISTNEVKRQSRLFRSIPEYIQRSVITIVRVYSMFNPFKLFVNLGFAFIIGAVFLGCRFLVLMAITGYGGKIQSLILAAILSIIGFQLIVIGIVSDLIAANRRLLEETLLRVKRLELKKG